ncbi:uncharacterized protein AKAME5_002404900 [Lates japonicus]|uniref:Uncharacterized protein n=1 Tax=Lates japonicus TaxID=270547 RepID=A0AAD3NKD2_LATJO|nr:uncharacterized protein AKAME5_002404900 [Lates japonicus]
MHKRPYSSGILNQDHQQYTNMNGLLPLLYCIGILGALLCGVQGNPQVCQLSRRLKMLSSSADLISGSEYWVGTAKKNKDKSEMEAKETSILMADLNQTKEGAADGTTKEEEGKVKEDGQTEEENKKEVGAAANSEEASAGENKEAPVENSSSSKPQEDTADSQPTEAVAAPSSEGTGEPKDAV